LTVEDSWLDVPVEHGGATDDEIGWYVYLGGISTWTGGDAKDQTVTDKEKQYIAETFRKALLVRYAFVTVEMPFSVQKIVKSDVLSEGG